MYKNKAFAKLTNATCPLYSFFFFFFFKHYKEADDTLQVCREIILQRQVFAKVSSLWRAVPFSFWRSTCPVGP